EDYMVRGGAALAPRTQKEVRRHLDKDILPRIGHLPAKSIGAAEIVPVVERVAERSYSVAGRIFEIMAVIFSHGAAKHAVQLNPCAGLRLSAIIGPPPSRRQRLNLSEAQLRDFVEALPALGRRNQLA